jgi:hypothetical protein
MKARISAFASAALIALAALALTIACDSDPGTILTPAVSDTQAAGAVTPPEGGAIDEALLGKWQYDPAPETREFNADGTMRATLGGLTSDGTYTADGSNLVVTVGGIPRAYTYTIQGDVLTLVDTEFGQAVNYNRVR